MSFSALVLFLSNTANIQQHEDKLQGRFTLIWRGLSCACRVVWSLGGNQDRKASADGCTPFYFSFMKKIILLVLYMLIGSVYTKAQSLIIEKTDGQKETYEINELPQIHFSDNELIVTTQQLEVKYTRSQIRKYYFNMTPTSVGNAKIYATFERKEDNITIRNIKPNSIAYIYNTGGILVEQKRVKKNAEVTFSLKGLPLGIYVIKTENKTYKITKQ